MSHIKTLLALITILLVNYSTKAQEDNISAFEISIDQDAFADFLHDDPAEAYNYATGLRLGIYGEYANHDYLGLPWEEACLEDADCYSGDCVGADPENDTPGECGPQFL